MTFKEELRELGWVEGKNVKFQRRCAKGQHYKLSDLATELGRLKVDLIVTGPGPRAARAAKGATATIPIVMVVVERLGSTREIMRFIAQEISPHTYVNVMAQYYAAGKVGPEKYAEINRQITRQEYQEAMRIAREEGISHLDPRELDYHRWGLWN